MSEDTHGLTFITAYERQLAGKAYQAGLEGKALPMSQDERRARIMRQAYQAGANNRRQRKGNRD